jgi:hypothetical protein
VKPNDPAAGYEIFVRRNDANLELISQCRRSFEEWQKFRRIHGYDPDPFQ